MYLLYGLNEPQIATGQDVPGVPATPEAQQCAALTALELSGLEAAPTKIVSATLVSVPAAGLDVMTRIMSSKLIKSQVTQYCDVAGYVAPQNRFELRLPIPAEWNHKFYFSACAGFCGSTNGADCNSGLARGYASVTSDGGHQGAFGFDCLWARNAPNLQADYGWRSNHVVTLAAKAITIRYYGNPMQHSYMTGCSKGGQAVLLEAQRFPNDYDGVISVAPVYDFTGRAQFAAAWFAQAVDDGRGASVLNSAVVDAIHGSVLAKCGAQAGIEEGLVTNPLACTWMPEMMACAAGRSDSTCLTPRQIEAVRRLMSPVLNSKGKIVFAYPYVPGSETEWAAWNFIPAGAPLATTLNFAIA